VILAVEWYSLVGLIFTFGGLVLAVIGIPRLVGGVRRQQLATAVASASATIDLLEKTNRIQGDAAGVTANGHLEALRADLEQLEEAATQQRSGLRRGIVGVLVLALIGGGLGLILVAQNNHIGDSQEDARETEARIECRQQAIAAYDVALGNLHIAESTGAGVNAVDETATALADAGMPLLDLDAKCGAPSG
jgi:hypothetical protein